jgi:ParB-like chromosome segregation protein Spo0J
MSRHTVIPNDTLDPQPIRVRLLRLDGETQHRVKIHKQAVADYVEALRSGQDLPPVEVVWDRQFYWVVDGHHRVEAHRQLGGKLAEIDCIVSRGSQQEAQWLSLGANRTHGIRRTLPDKRNAVLFALKHPEFKSKSDRQIAEQTGVDHKTVGRLRKQTSGEFPTSPKPGPTAQELLAKAIAAADRATGLSWQGQVLRRDGTTSFELSASTAQPDSHETSTESITEVAR